MRAYSSNSFRGSSRSSGSAWKRTFITFVVGLICGIIIATLLNARRPVEVVFSGPPASPMQTPETVVDTETPAIWSESKNISVRTPVPNARVRSPLSVEGLERTFEQNVVVRLKDGKDNELAKIAVTGTAPEPGIHGPYRAELTFEKPATKTGTLEVFQGSPKDGSEIDKVTIPLRFE